MGKKLMLAIAMLALVAMPAFASVQNVKVSGDLKTTSVIRKNFFANNTSSGYETTSTDGHEKSQNVVLSQVGVNIQADLTDNVSTFIRMGNERIWGEASNSSVDGVNMDAAYVTMKEMLYSPLTVTVGRQPLAYGNQLLIGDSGAYNEVNDVNDLTGGVNFDAIKAVLSYDPLTVDIFMAKVAENTTGLEDDDDKDLYGINANYKLGDKMNSVVEGYVFATNDKSGVTGTETKGDRLYVPGLRVSTNPIEGLNVQLEGAYQFGSEEATLTGNGYGKDIQAYGLQGGVNYALPVMKDMKPVLSAGYTYLSGDEDTAGRDSKSKAWRTMYEGQNGGRIFDTMSGTNTNVKMANLAIEMTPVQDITTKLSWYNLSKAKKAVGTPARSKIGDEIDLDVTYAYTEDVKFGVSAGLFVPGQANGELNQDNASQVLSSVQVMF